MKSPSNQTSCLSLSVYLLPPHSVYPFLCLPYFPAPSFFSLILAMSLSR